MTYAKMLETARQAGINVISKDRACQLMACVFRLGGEAFVLNERLYVDSMHAAKMLGFEVMGLPDQEAIKQIIEYCWQIDDGKPEWLTELEKKYRVTLKPEPEAGR